MYTELEPYDESFLWIVILGFILAFILAIALGSNDVANAFGTSYGSGVLTLTQIYILGSIFETSGAILLGARVSDTIRKGIFDVTLYNNGSEDLLMVGEISALLSSTIWLLTATVATLPISASHSVVGATLGFHFVIFGVTGVQWRTVISIAISWVFSPAFSGFLSLIIIFIAKYGIIDRKNTIMAGRIAIPLFYFATIFINFFSIFYSGVFGLDNLDLWLVLVISFSAGFSTGILVFIIVIPILSKKIKALENSEMQEVNNIKVNGKGESQIDSSHIEMDSLRNSTHLNGTTNNGFIMTVEENFNTEDSTHTPIDVINVKNILTKNTMEELNPKALDIKEGDNIDVKDIEVCSEDSDNPDSEPDADAPAIAILFTQLQILTACFGSFAHGGNDVSNAISPLVAIWTIYTSGTVDGSSSTPIWILFYGGVGISVGLILFGKRVMKTIGKKLTKVTPSSGFSIVLGSATTVLIASTLGIPISTTSCQVGSVVTVGWFRNNRNHVKWKLFMGIFTAWIVTLPVTIGLSAGIMFCLQWIYI